MPYEVSVKQVPAQTVASLTVTTSLAGIGAEMGRGFAALAARIGAAGGTPAGPPFVIYHDVIDAQTPGRISLCVPAAEGDAEIAASLVACVTHRGPYAEISPAYHVLAGWIEENGREAGGAPREVYLNDPRTVAPEDLLTEVQFPIVR